jgi:hypothetical protein
MISKHVADSLSKVVVSGEKSKNSDVGGKSSREKSSSEKNGSRKRSVFDRLLSPSNLTGTQKQKYEENNGKRNCSGTLNLEKSWIVRPPAQSLVS